MKTKNTIYKTSCLIALLLAASVGFKQTSSALQRTTESVSSSRTKIRGVLGVSAAQVGPQVGDIHAEVEEDHCCQVILVPVKGPPTTIHLMQSSERFTINATFDTNITAAQRAVIQQAVDEWEGIIKTRGFTPADYPITFSNGPLAGSIGLATVTFDKESGNLISTKIVFDNDGSTAWFVDTTPDDDIEFNANPPAGVDLLTVARHEIGHAVGILDIPRVTSLLNGNIFDPSRLNIATVDSGGHTDPNININDLMIPTLGDSTRRVISLYPDAALVARAYHYDITMRFVDAGYGGTERGSANEPWSTFTDGVSLTPAEQQLLVIPEIYHEAMPLVLSVPMTISAARGGNAVIAGP